MMRNVCKRTWAFLLVAAMLLSVVMVSALEEVPAYNDPKGLTEYADEILGGVGGNGWSDEHNMNEVLKDFAWRPQYYDANPDWDGFYTFKWVKGNTWSNGPIDEYVFGQNWLNSNGQFSYQGGVWYMVTNANEVNVMSFTFIAPKDGVYKVYGNSDIKVMYPQYFPVSGNLRLGFAIHKMAADADMNTFDPAGSTRIWPADKNYEYLTNETLSFAFPTLEEVELKAGERLRFILDARETEGVDDWLASAAVCPMVVGVSNEAPTAQDVDASCTVGKSVSGNLLGADADVDDTLTYALKSDGQQGTAVVNADGTFTYTASKTATGNDSFTYTVTDRRGATAEAKVNISFVENKKPVAADSAFSVMEGVKLDGDLHVSDGDGDALTVDLKADGANGKATVAADGTFSYQPNEKFVGKDTFTVTITDGVDTVEVTVTVDVKANEVPVAEDITVNGDKDKAVNITLKATDANGTALSYAIATQPKNGTVTIDGNGAVYTPNAGFIGFDSFTYTANDGVNTSEAATVTVAVLADGIDSVATLKDAIIECGDDVDFDKDFDFSAYAYDLPWQFHYRIDGITTNFDDEGITEFYTSIAAKIFDWGGWKVGDGNTYPSNTIQNQGNVLVHCLNSGSIADSQNPIAALAFVAPEDGTYYFTAGEATDLFGIWPGQATQNGIRVWIEANDGTVVWPADGSPLTLDKDNSTVALPNLTVAMKANTALRFCMSGTTANEWNNNVFLAPVAYTLGAYDEELDPVKPEVEEDKEDPKDPSEDPKDDGEQGGGNVDSGDVGGSGSADEDATTSPDTGYVAPMTMLLLACSSSTAMLLLRKRRRTN